MSSSGPRYPGTTGSEIGPSGDNDWISTSPITADDGTEAQITAATYDAADHSYRLKATNFGFTIPAGATIDGILVEIDRRCFAGAAQDQEVRIYNASATLVGDDKQTATAWPASLAIASYGGSADTWAASPTPTMVNDADFGVALIVLADAANTDIGVDFIRVTITYHETHEAAAGLDGAATLAAVGQMTANAIVALTGSATLAATGAIEQRGIASLEASATLAATGRTEANAQAALTGVATVDAPGQVTAQATAILAATGILAAPGTVLANAVAVLDATATLAATGRVEANASALLAATGTIVAEGMVLGQANGDAILAATASLTAVAVVEVNATAILAATASLAAAGSLQVEGSAILAATAILTPAGRVEANAAAILSATATLAAAGTSQPPFVAGSAILSAFATVTMTASIYAYLPTFDMIDRILSLIEPSPGSLKVQRSQSLPAVYQRDTLYVVEEAVDDRARWAAEPKQRQDFGATFVLVLDDQGEHAALTQKRAVTTALDAKATAYMAAIRANQATVDWHRITARLQRDFVQGFGVRGFAVRVDGYRLL